MGRHPSEKTAEDKAYKEDVRFYKLLKSAHDAGMKGSGSASRTP